MLTPLALTGRTDRHVLHLHEPSCTLHPDAAAAFLAMRDAARRDGIALHPVSSFRDFAAQAQIWNGKFHGERPLYDAAGQLREVNGLGEDERIDAILCWSALPGGSRHHWGSDLDVIDRAALPAGRRVELLPAAFEDDGPFGPLRHWLDAHMAHFGFFYPYDRYRGGLYAEPWHISYGPVAAPALASLTQERVREAIESAELAGGARLVARLPDLYPRYVTNVAPWSAPPAS